MSSFHKLIGIGLKALGTDAEPIRHIYVLVTHRQLQAPSTDFTYQTVKK